MSAQQDFRHLPHAITLFLAAGGQLQVVQAGD